MTDFTSFFEQDVNSESLPRILSELGLLHVFIRRVLLNRYTADILPSPEDQVRFQRSFFKTHHIVDKTSLDTWLLKNSIDESEMSLHLYRSLKLEIFKQKKFAPDIDSYFLNHKSEFDFCYFSLLRTKKRESINELYLRLTEDEDTFSSLASQFSFGSESQSNGYIGPRPFSQIHPEFAERLRISNPGQLWSPFKVNDFWCIVRLERIIKASLDQPTRLIILNKLFENWIKQKVDSLVSSFGSVGINDAIIPNQSDLSSDLCT